MSIRVIVTGGAGFIGSSFANLCVSKGLDVLVVDKLAELYIYGSEVDFIEEFGNSSLVIRNPNATATCGCGESFAV